MIYFKNVINKVLTHKSIRLRKMKKIIRTHKKLKKKIKPKILITQK